MPAPRKKGLSTSTLDAGRKQKGVKSSGTLDAGKKQKGLKTSRLEEPDAPKKAAPEKPAKSAKTGLDGMLVTDPVTKVQYKLRIKK